MSRLFSEPIPADLAWSEGELVAIELIGVRLPVVEVVRRWRVNGEWWDSRLAHARDYLTVRTADGTLCDLCRDGASGRWALQRLYD